VNHAMWRHAIAGGNFSNGSYCGARTLNTNANPWNANGNVGVRGVCDPSIDSREPPACPADPDPRWISRPHLVRQRRL